jgi:hypothetical protein
VKKSFCQSNKTNAYIFFFFVSLVPSLHQGSDFFADDSLSFGRIVCKERNSSWNVEDDFGVWFVLFGSVHKTKEEKVPAQMKQSPEKNNLIINLFFKIFLLANKNDSFEQIRKK